jgi:hypothetical protein
LSTLRLLLGELLFHEPTYAMKLAAIEVIRKALAVYSTAACDRPAAR